MPSTIHQPEIPAAFGALDSDVYADGEPLDAHVARELVRSGNRLMCAGEPLVHFVWDAGTENGDEVFGAIGYGYPFWIQITPGPLTRTKMPGHEFAKVMIRFKLGAGEVGLIQVCTSKRPFDANRAPDADNMLKLEGTGGFEWAELGGIPLEKNADVEYITFWLRCEPTSTLGNAGVYGAPNTGTISAQPTDARKLQHDGAQTWNTTGSTWATGGHIVVVKDGSGNELTEPRAIVAVEHGSYYSVGLGAQVVCQRLFVYPNWRDGIEQALIPGKTFEIYQAARWRITSISMYCQDRVA